MKRCIAVLSMVVLLAGAAPAAAEIVTAFQVATEGEDLFPFMTNLTGLTSDITLNSQNVCFNASSDNNFNWGDRIAFNAYFSDTVARATQIYDITLVVKFRNKRITLVKRAAIFNLSGVPIGTPLNFCVAEFIRTGGNRPPLDILWGKLIRRRDTGQGLGGVLGSFVIQ